LKQPSMFQRHSTVSSRFHQIDRQVFQMIES
jgi:hypothetical protein